MAANLHESDKAIIDRVERCLRAAVARTGAAVSDAQMDAMVGFMKTAEVDDGDEASRAAKLEQLESAAKEELEAMCALFGAAGLADKPKKCRPGPTDPSVARLKGLAEECRLLLQPIASEAARATLEASTEVWDAVTAWVDAGEAEVGTAANGVREDPSRSRTSLESASGVVFRRPRDGRIFLDTGRERPRQIQSPARRLPDGPPERVRRDRQRGHRQPLQNQLGARRGRGEGRG